MTGKTTLDDVLITLDEMIAIDTTSHLSNLPFLDAVEARLAGTGAVFERFPDASGEKANLFVTIGPADAPGYVLSGHCDTVPVDGQTWSTSPFQLSRNNGRLVGRGAVDMKGFLAVCVAMAPEMARARLRRPIHIAISYDEETGCVGVRRMLTALAARDRRPAGCFVGEPTGMEVVIGHKAKRAMRVSVRGAARHSSHAPRGVNAIEWAAELICEIRRIARSLEASGPRDELYDVPHTTGLTSVVRGGVALNIVPADCAFEFEFRAIGADDPDRLVAEVIAVARDRLEPAMRAIDPDAGFRFDEIVSYPGLDVDPSEPIVTLAKALSGRNGHAKVAFGAEAGLFQDMAGVPTVVVGPGSITQAHKPDEYVEVAQIEACVAFVRRLIAHCEA